MEKDFRLSNGLSYYWGTLNSGKKQIDLIKESNILKIKKIIKFPNTIIDIFFGWFLSMKFRKN